jgi:hypothetical protein
MTTWIGKILFQRGLQRPILLAVCCDGWERPFKEEDPIAGLDLRNAAVDKYNVI